MFQQGVTSISINSRKHDKHDASVSLILIIVYTNDLVSCLFVENYPQFWPGELCSETQYGPLTVELLEYDDNPTIVSRFFRIRKVRRSHADALIIRLPFTI